LTSTASALFKYDLFYDNNLIAHGLDNLTQHANFNGNINGTSALYDLSGTLNGAGVGFDDTTLYGYSYDGLNRLTQADAVMVEVATGGPTDPTWNNGDASFAYDKIGNMLNILRYEFD
jgi:hypothetical protein